MLSHKCILLFFITSETSETGKSEQTGMKLICNFDLCQT